MAEKCDDDVCKKKLNFEDIAEILIIEQPIKFYNGVYYLFSEKKGYLGYYPIDIKILKPFIHQFIKKLKTSEKIGPISETMISNVLNYVNRDTNVEYGSINPKYINVNNGILDISVYPPLFIDPNPEYFTPLRIPITYDRRAECPKIDAFLRDITTDKSGQIRPNEYDVLTLYEMIGYALESSYFIHKGFMLIGLTHNGKSTYCNLLSHFLGDDNISILSLYDVDKFAAKNLINKMANIKADLGSYTKLPNKVREKFKEFTGEEHRIDTHVKHAPDSIYFKNRAKMYFGCNANYSGKGLPGLDKNAINDIAFIGRWVIIYLPNTYPDKRDFINPLLESGEMSGLLNKALEGLNRLRKQNKFSISNAQDLEELKKIWEGARTYDVRLLDEEEVIEVPIGLSDTEPFKLKDYSEIKSGYWAISKIRIHVPRSILDQPKKISKDKDKK